MSEFKPEYNFYPLDDAGITTQAPSGGMDIKDTAQYNTKPVDFPINNVVSAPNGVIMAGGQMQSPNFATGVSGWIIRADGSVEFDSGYFRGDITGASGTFSGTITATAINIPDATTANSFHVDSSGNTWWGANVATGYAGAPAYVLATGAAKFKSIEIGGANYQYTMTDTGNLQFGDGNDGAAAFNGTDAVTGASRSGSDYTLTRDVYYTTATMSTGTTLNPAGYRIFCSVSLTLNGTALIKRDGNNGTNGSNGSAGGGGAGGAGGAALADGYLKGSVAGSTGGAGVASGNGNDGVAGTSTSNSVGSAGVSGGRGGNTNPSLGGAGGTVGSASQYNVRPYDPWHVKEMLDIGSTGATVKYDNSGASSGGGGGCGGGAGTGGGGGGGGGSAGGIIVINAKHIIIGASAVIRVLGGNGGDGGNGSGNGGSSGGGGGGGNGGQVFLTYNTIANSGTITLTGGTGGATGSAGGGNGEVGVAGANGTTGTLRTYVVSI